MNVSELIKQANYADTVNQNILRTNG